MRVPAEGGDAPGARSSRHPQHLNSEEPRPARRECAEVAPQRCGSPALELRAGAPRFSRPARGWRRVRPAVLGLRPGRPRHRLVNYTLLKSTFPASLAPGFGCAPGRWLIAVGRGDLGRPERWPGMGGGREPR
ncbi:hypothetical protein P7K49_009921 [Saguinus oedipus]|uniref:Uncharacterized protein n=1 Tax=Saguinus oedipus TaxID=9490 RepID=A0ABQ9VM61_SAGOE|nr:hypothetical protein P7K49_009921 [Saguinus oedipus]